MTEKGRDRRIFISRRNYMTEMDTCSFRDFWYVAGVCVVFTPFVKTLIPSLQ